MIAMKDQHIKTSYVPTGTPVSEEGQNVKTSYDTPSKKSRSERIEDQADRRESNRRQRDDTTGSKVTRSEAKEISRRDSAPVQSSGGKKVSKADKASDTPEILVNIKRNVGGYVERNNGQPTWMTDGRQARRQSKQGNQRATAPMPYSKMPYAGGTSDIPAWVLNGKMPWEQPAQKSSQNPNNDVTKVIITRVHADGRKTRSVRNIGDKQVKSTRPNWIQY